MANFIPSQYSLINFAPSKLSLRSASYLISFFGVLSKFHIISQNIINDIYTINIVRPLPINIDSRGDLKMIKWVYKRSRFLSSTPIKTAIQNSIIILNNTTVY